MQKPPSKGVLGKGVLKIYCKRTPITKCDFNKVAKRLYENHTSAWVFSCQFAAYVQNIFSKDHLWSAASAHSKQNKMIVKYIFVD